MSNGRVRNYPTSTDHLAPGKRLDQARFSESFAKERLQDGDGTIIALDFLNGLLKSTVEDFTTQSYNPTGLRPRESEGSLKLEYHDDLVGILWRCSAIYTAALGIWLRGDILYRPQDLAPRVNSIS